MGEWIEEGLEWKDAMFPSYNFSFIPEAAQIAANYQEIAENLPGDKSLTPFSRVMRHYKLHLGPVKSLMDMRDFMKAHRSVFVMGFAAASEPSAVKGMAISEEYFRKILE